MPEIFKRSFPSRRLEKIAHFVTDRISRPQRLITLMMVCVLLTSIVAIAAVPGSTVASYIDVLDNGGFEHGFGDQPGCGTVGTGWHCFTNGGAANYGFYDDQWTPVVADGGHSQLIEINAKGIPAPDHDRYAGLYQTVRVVDWAEYTLNLKGMIRTTLLDGDPWRYRVEVGWTNGHFADWTRVSNWQDVGWDSYYDRESPGGFSAYSTRFMAEADYLTIYVRVWKKWGVSGEEIDINLDTISLTGPSPYHHDYGYGKDGYGKGGPVTDTSGKPYGHDGDGASDYVPSEPSGGMCGGKSLIYNGSFEDGFNPTAVGHVGKSWGYFTNGGAANYGFYDDQWGPILADGGHAQLIEINSKGLYPADADRYAGIYQRITWLKPGATYQLTINGILRGEGNEDDPYRFEAQWGYNPGYDADWMHVNNWQTIDLGEIQSRTSPTGNRTYTVQFTAPSSEIVLFLRGWKKWGISEVEMDLNFDKISLYGCEGGYPSHPDKPKPHPGGGNCTYIVSPGDILSLIAQRYGVRVHDLMYANNIANANLIYVGQVLQIPGCSEAPVAIPLTPTPVPPTATPVAIPVTPTYVPEYKPDHKPEYRPEHKPTPAPAPAAHRIHVVAPGESLGYICNQYGVDINTLARINNIANVNLIYVGQELIVP
ncbi:MAG: LysM peptidoglycan-binding domain-containing protein [Caldilineaceae bacterium]|nr:LysM peptidoglycan-binding domain-containing protein [Caldilineaceae bacterium]